MGSISVISAYQEVEPAPMEMNETASIATTVKRQAEL